MKPGDRRKAYGEARASVIESLLAILYPGSKLDWDSQLLHIPGENPHLFEVPVYVRGSQANGGLEGVASVELDRKKEEFIFQAKRFQQAENRVFPTLLIVFRADPSGHIEKYKKFMLDPKEPLTQIKDFSIQDWTTQEWPKLNVQYDTHRAGPDSFTTIEWHAVFDAASSQLVSRMPFGITRKVKGGAEQPLGFSIARTSQTQITIRDRWSEEIHTYDCSDPCVIDADMLLSQWVR
jgi:hypothetical protein